jgi:hypothetical protein
MSSANPSVAGQLFGPKGPGQSGFEMPVQAGRKQSDCHKGLNTRHSLPQCAAQEPAPAFRIRQFLLQLLYQ